MKLKIIIIKIEKKLSTGITCDSGHKTVITS